MLSSSANAAEQNHMATSSCNMTLLSLGFLLIQVIMGSPIEHLEITEGMDLDCLLEKQANASRLCESGRMLISGGRNYAAAAQWCLDNVFNRASLEDEKFCHEFCSEVISRLETDMGYQSLKL